jgi:transposase
MLKKEPLFYGCRCSFNCHLTHAQKKLIFYRQKANRLYFESGWSKNRIARSLGMSKHTIIRWTQSPDQDFTRDHRGWPKGKRRKWSVTTEARIRSIHQALVDDPEEFFYGATAIAYQWRMKYPDAPPPIRTIGQILKDLELSKPRSKGRVQSATEYLCYPEQTIYGGFLGQRVMEADFIRRYLKGRSSPLHFIGFSAKKAPRLRHFVRIRNLTTDVFIEACDTFFDQFERPQVLKLDNAATFIGSTSGKRTLSQVMIYLLNRQITPVFAVPRRPFTQASIEGNNSVFSRYFWNRRTFNTLADLDRQLAWFNNASLRYTDYQKPDFKKNERPFTPNIYFLRQIKESESKPGQGSISILNEEIPLPTEWINFFVVAQWNLKNETLTVFKEQNKQLKTLYQNSFFINKTTKEKLKQTGALSFCI